MDRTNIRAKIEALEELEALDMERIISRAAEEVAELAGLDREYAGDRALAVNHIRVLLEAAYDEGRLHEVANAEATRKTIIMTRLEELGTMEQTHAVLAEEEALVAELS